MIILSPSKGQDFSPVAPGLPWTQALFSAQARELIATLAPLDPDALAALLAISPALAQRTAEQIRAWSLPHLPINAKQALLAFAGEAYRCLAAATFTTADLADAQDRVRILSGLYGCLRPLDLIQPHRLEMANRITPPRGRNLYAFWGPLVIAELNRALRAEASPLLINLASSEYSRVLDRRQLEAPWLDLHFQEEGGKRTVAIFAKRARGMMAAFLIRNRHQDAETIKSFSQGGYRYCRQDSTASRWVFTRPPT